MCSYANFDFKAQIPKLKQIIRESIDVAFAICLERGPDFHPLKLNDVFRQILPGAIVYNTAYWPYFKTLNKDIMCVCRRFGIKCIHTKPTILGHHCINMEYDKHKMIIPRRNKNCYVRIKTDPVRYNVQLMVTPKNLPAGYLMSVKIILLTTLKTGKDKTKEIIENFYINARLTLVPYIYPAQNSIHYNSRAAFTGFSDKFLRFRDTYQFPEKLKSDFFLSRDEMCPWTLSPYLTIVNNVHPDIAVIPIEKPDEVFDVYTTKGDMEKFFYAKYLHNKEKFGIINDLLILYFRIMINKDKKDGTSSGEKNEEEK